VAVCYHPRVPRSSTAIAVALLVALIGSAVGAAPAAAAPTVAIRARAELLLKSVRRLDDGRVEVRGQLRDRAAGVGLGGEPVTVGLGGVEAAAAITAPDGTFEAFAEAPAGPIDVQLDFRGGATIDAASVSAAAVDPSKAPVDLTISTQVTPLGVLVTVIATSDGVPLVAPVAVRVSSADDDEPHHDATLTTGTPQLIKRADALGAGTRRLVARYAGDPSHSAATTSAVVQLTSETRTELHLTDRDVGFDATLRARGRVTDADGTALARVTVTLLGDDQRRLGSATTGPDGKYGIDVEASLVGAGRHGLVAAVETREAWLRPSQSTAAFVDIGAPQPPPVLITVAAFAATALTALGFILARRRREHGVATSVAVEPRLVDEPRGGLEPARASLVSTLRRASDHGFAGMVRDSVRSRPLAAATVELSLGAEARRADTGDDGQFAFEALSPGEWTCRVQTSGHVAERFTVTVPHRGELRGVRVDLVPVRERVFAIYRNAALPLLPRPELWGIWSPRQIVDHVRAQRPPAALVTLTALVEEVYFSARVNEEAIISTAEARAADAIAERAHHGAIGDRAQGR